VRRVPPMVTSAIQPSAVRRTDPVMVVPLVVVVVV
jgi:hypothetical protein